jgi:hypothetical protein
MCVRRPAAGHTQAITPKFGMGSSFHPGLAPSQGATPNVGPRGYLPYCPRLNVPERLRIGWGPENKSCSSGWVCLVKFYFLGAHPNLGPTGSNQPTGGVCFENWAGASKQKLLLRVGLPDKILFLGANPHPGPAGSTPPKWGICFWAIILKFGRCFSFHLSLMICWWPHPRPCPWPCPRPRPLFLLSSIDHSARDYFTIVLWNSPGQRRVAHASLK